MKIQLQVIFLLIISCFTFLVKAQNNGTDSEPNFLKTLHPSVAAVIGIISVILSMTFLILAYAKFCQRYPLDVVELEAGIGNGSRPRFSGIDQAVINSLPFFTFSSLKGSKQGLECAVCLSKFEETEVLRLLPKCKHAFHRTCIDKWLHVHSSCPLCRSKIDPKDIGSFNSSTTLRYSRTLSNLTDEPDLEIFIEREQSRQGSSRFSFNIGSISFRDKRKRQQELVVQVRDHSGNRNRKILHRFKHKIIVSDVLIKNRWSDVNSSDLLLLSSEMLGGMSSRRMSPSVTLGIVESEKAEGIERKNSLSSSTSNLDDQKSRMINNPGEKRSMSEITQLSRSRSDLRNASVIKEHACSKNYAREEKIRRLWLPIAQRTVQRLAGRENKLQELEYKRQISEI